MKWYDAGPYRCDQCQAVHPLMLATPEPVPVAVGGIHAPKFVSHGPTNTCRCQIFHRVEEEEPNADEDS